jgi:hypothetical protein
VHTDATIDRFAVEEKAAMLREGLGTPEHDIAKRAVITAQRHKRNTADGYWIAASDLQAAEHSTTGEVPFVDVRRAAGAEYSSAV